MRETLTIAVTQPLCVAYDGAANAATHAAAVRSAHACVVVFPELSLTGYELDASAGAVDDPRLAPIVAAGHLAGGAGGGRGDGRRRGPLEERARSARGAKVSASSPGWRSGWRSRRSATWSRATAGTWFVLRHDANRMAPPERAGRKINTTSSLLAALLETGGVVGRTRNGTRWVCELAMCRDEGLRKLARRAVEGFRKQTGGGGTWCGRGWVR